MGGQNRALRLRQMRLIRSAFLASNSAGDISPASRSSPNRRICSSGSSGGLAGCSVRP
jgi:hypothetical protein